MRSRVTQRPSEGVIWWDIWLTQDQKPLIKLEDINWPLIKTTQIFANVVSFITATHRALIKSNKLIFVKNSASDFTQHFIGNSSRYCNESSLTTSSGWHVRVVSAKRINISRLPCNMGCNITELVCRQSNQVRRIWFCGAHGGLEFSWIALCFL